MLHSGLHVVGEFKLERIFQQNDLLYINENLERTFPYKTFQLNDLSNCSFQLYAYQHCSTTEKLTIIFMQ